MRVTMTVTPKDPRLSRSENEAAARTTDTTKAVGGGGTVVPGKALGSVGWSQGLTLSQKFQSIKVECSVTLPVAISVGNPERIQAEVERGVAEARELVQTELANALADQEATLHDIIRRVGR